MRGLRHWWTQRALERVFVSGRCRGVSWVRGHLRGCPDCRRRFDRLAAVDRALAGDSARPGRFEQAWSSLVVSALAHEVDEPVGRSTRGPGLAAGAALVLALGFTLGRPDPPTPEPKAPTTGGTLIAPQSRGTERLSRRAEGTVEPMIHFACVRPPPALDRQPEGGRRLRCRTDEGLGFSAWSGPIGAPYRHLTLWSVGADGSHRYYHPRPADEDGVSMAVRPDSRLTPLGDVLRLAEHPPGRFTLFAIYTERPLRRLIRAADAVEPDCADLDAGSCHTIRLTLVVEPTGGR